MTDSVRSAPSDWRSLIAEATNRESLGEHEEADKLLSQGLDLFPDERWIRHHYARSANLIQDWDEAVGRWQDLVLRFPDHAVGFAEFGGACRQAGLLDRADVILTEAIRVFPEERWIAHQHALVSGSRADWKSAADRWQEVVSNFPDHAAGYAGYSVALRHLGRFRDADEVLSKALLRFPHEQAIVYELAMVSTASGETINAVIRWRSLMTQFPLESLAYVECASALRQAQRFEEAEKLLRDGMHTFPNEKWIVHQYALIASVTKNWREAEIRWRDFCTRFPTAHDGIAHLCEALLHRDESGEADVIAQQAIERFGFLPSLLEAKAKVSESKRNWMQAIEAWQLSCHISTGQTLLPPEKVTLEKLHLATSNYKNIFSYWHDGSFEQMPSVGLWKTVFGTKYSVITDEQVLAIISKRYPDFLEVYRAIQIPACRADVARLIYLGHVGGLYLDMHVTIGNLERLFDLSNVIRDFEVGVFSYPLRSGAEGFRVGNSIIVSRPEAQPIASLISIVVSNLTRQYERETSSPEHVAYNIFELSGPFVLESELFEDDRMTIRNRYARTVANVKLQMSRCHDAFHPWHFYSYRKNGMHWSERQRVERLFTFT